MFKTFGAGERESGKQQPDGYFATFFLLLSLRSQWIVQFIHSLSLSLWTRSLFEQKGDDDHIIPIRLFKLMTLFRHNYFSSFCGSAIARDLYFLPPSWLLQAAILLKITLLIVVRSKAILKFKLKKEIQTGSQNLNILMILATTTKNEMHSDSLFWLTCVAQYKWWLSSVITHPPDVAQNSNYLSIRYHIFTRNHNVLSVFFVTVASSDTLTFPYT